MALTELFTNNPSTTVTTGGTTAPVSGTSETWTVASSATFPAAATGVSQFHVADTTSAAYWGELIAVTNVSGTTWTVTRGAESTTPVAHPAGFTITQVVTAGFLGGLLPAAGATMTGKLAPAVVALTDGATISLNAAQGNVFAVTLAASGHTLASPTNPADGQAIRVRVTQGGSGSNTLSYGAAYDFGTAGQPTLSTSAGARDILGFEYDADLSGGKWCYLGAGFGF